MTISKTKLLLGLLIIIFSAQNLWAKSHIQINFPGAENQKAVIWTYKDLFFIVTMFTMYPISHLFFQ